MNTPFRKLFITLMTMLVIAGVVSACMLQGWFVKKYEPNELAELLSPHFRVYRPPQKGLFPTVVGFHGCRGINDGTEEWMKYFVDQGYAGILVDSFAFRHLNTDSVCSGRALWGSERAGDLVVALDSIKALPFVDPENIVLMGWSHGAWTIMDALALDPPRHLPTNLYHVPENPLRGVKGVVLMYPYCGFPAEARNNGWDQPLPALLIMAGRDTVVSTSDCVDIAQLLKQSDKPISTHIYPHALHAFDINKGRADKATLVDTRHRVSHFLAPLLGGDPCPAQGCRRSSRSDSE